MDLERERLAWIRLALAQGTGRPWARDLVLHLGTATQAAHADRKLLEQHFGRVRGRDRYAALRRVRAARVLAHAEERGQAVLTPADAGWPAARFEGMADPPCSLFVQGRLPPPDAVTVALVGTRDASPYGLRVAGALGAELAAAGCWIVSGFALGVDGAAHDAAVAVDGATVALLGCGVDHDYPVAHGELRERVVIRGGLASEHPPGVEPRRHHFPRRNRLVAALSDVVVVIEAPERSGSLITARLALELGREVLAVPGSIFRPNQEGCHLLLRQGAGLCAGSQDVRHALGWEGDRASGPGSSAARRFTEPQDAHEGAVWRALDDEEAQDANAICLRTGLNAEDVAVALTGLELSGRARRLAGVGFVRG